jgi:sialate O-acetylesterase
MTALRLGALFSDHLVLQRDRENRIWGWDAPGQTITLTVLGIEAVSSRTALAAADGSFTVSCPILPAGGPYELRVTGSETLILRDVLVGEVWLASGQSNMEWPVLSADDAEREIDAAHFPAIRQVKIEPRALREETREATAEWQVCEPESVAQFSAVAYFFERHLHEHLQIPIGVIDATWGGTSIDAWLSVEALRDVDPNLDARLAELDAELRDLPRVRAEYQARLSAWERAVFPADPPNVGFERGYADLGFDDSAWQVLELPTFWQNHGMRFNGVVWFRREIELSHGGEDDLLLELGAIDDFDHTYFNGTLVGSHPDGTADAYRIPRRYVVPMGLVRPGKNVIAVRVFDHFGQGGFAGPKRAMFIEPLLGQRDRISLATPWRFCVEHEIPLVSGTDFGGWPGAPAALALQNAPGALFNGMLAPLFPYGLRGVIWYQGESDADHYATYGARFLAFIRDLRRRFGDPSLWFLFVELAGFRASGSWPFLREAQASVLGEPNMARATAIDIGDAEDIHPRNKQEVGRRLALLARSRAYGERGLEDSGPIFERLQVEGREISVHFTHAAGLRARAPGTLRGFELADASGRFRIARARIVDARVVLDCDEVSAPCAVRYGWDDCPDGTLENGAGLPAFPFRTTQ